MINDLTKYSSLSLDSRSVEKNSLFFSRGKTVEENSQYISDAIAAGASAVVVEVGLLPDEISVPFFEVENLSQVIGETASEFYGHPSRDLIVIGVTGTNGKTSITHFLAQAFAFLDERCGVIGTIGYGFIDDLEVGDLTTPDAITLQKQLKKLRDAGAKYVAMEVTSHALEQYRVASVEFDVAVFTNLTRDHLDYHGDMAAYGSAKKKLFNDFTLKSAVINIDDEFGLKLFSELKNKSKLKNKSNILGVSLEHESGENLLTGRDLKFKAGGVCAEVDSPWGEVEVEMQLIGSFNLSNALAVVGVLCQLGIMFEDAVHAMVNLVSVEGRMQRFVKRDGTLFVVDYAHTPDALEKSLRALRSHNQGRLWCIFGCGGDRDKGKRSMMGRIAEKYSDVCVVTNDNPRFEEPTKITDEILVGFEKPGVVKVINDRRAAIEFCVSQAGADDIVLIAGKGHETFQEINGERHHFSDAEELEKIL